MSQPHPILKLKSPGRSDSSTSEASTLSPKRKSRKGGVRSPHSAQGKSFKAIPQVLTLAVLFVSAEYSPQTGNLYICNSFGTPGFCSKSLFLNQPKSVLKWVFPPFCLQIAALEEASCTKTLQGVQYSRKAASAGKGLISGGLRALKAPKPSRSRRRVQEQGLQKAFVAPPLESRQGDASTTEVSPSEGVELALSDKPAISDAEEVEADGGTQVAEGAVERVTEVSGVGQLFTKVPLERAMESASAQPTIETAGAEQEAASAQLMTEDSERQQESASEQLSIEPGAVESLSLNIDNEQKVLKQRQDLEERQVSARQGVDSQQVDGLPETDTADPFLASKVHIAGESWETERPRRAHNEGAADTRFSGEGEEGATVVAAPTVDGEWESRASESAARGFAEGDPGLLLARSRRLRKRGSKAGRPSREVADQEITIESPTQLGSGTLGEALLRGNEDVAAEERRAGQETGVTTPLFEGAAKGAQGFESRDDVGGGAERGLEQKRESGTFAVERAERGTSVEKPVTIWRATQGFDRRAMGSLARPSFVEDGARSERRYQDVWNQRGQVMREEKRRSGGAPRMLHRVSGHQAVEG